MTFWINQPLKLAENDQSNLEIIDLNPEVDRPLLPDDFELKTLHLGYLDDIVGLINNHYVEDKQSIIRLNYSKDFLYWYLKQVSPGFLVGLIYKKKLVGIITAAFFDIIVYDNLMKLPYVNFLCVQSKARHFGLATWLIAEIKYRLSQIKITYALFTTNTFLSAPFCASKDYVIPINYSRLRTCGFLREDLTSIPKLDENPLHLMMPCDIPCVVSKLNQSMSTYKVKPYFTEDNVHHLLLPKKRIVYSFVNKNDDGEVTDFVAVYHGYHYCLEKRINISVATLAFYYHETMDLTKLITYLVDKLIGYEFDQLLFRDTEDNNNIKMTKFSTNGQLFYYFYNMAIKETKSTELSFYPL